MQITVALAHKALMLAVTKDFPHLQMGALGVGSQCHKNILAGYALEQRAELLEVLQGRLFDRMRLPERAGRCRRRGIVVNTGDTRGQCIDMVYCQHLAVEHCREQHRLRESAHLYRILNGWPAAAEYR